MTAFARQKLSGPSPIVIAARRRPFLTFGLPFIGILVASSFALSSLTSTRYELREQKVQTMNKEEALNMDKNRRKVDIREEYFRLKSKDMVKGEDEWENKRVPRLPGQSEWGEDVQTRMGK